LDICSQYFVKELGIAEFAIMDAEEAEKSGNKNLVNFGANAVPGKPQIMLE